MSEREIKELDVVTLRGTVVGVFGNSLAIEFVEPSGKGEVVHVASVHAEPPAEPAQVGEVEEELQAAYGWACAEGLTLLRDKLSRALALIKSLRAENERLSVGTGLEGELLAPFVALAKQARELGHDEDSTCEWRIRAGDLYALERAAHAPKEGWVSEGDVLLRATTVEEPKNE